LDDISILKKLTANQTERAFEQSFDFPTTDDTAKIIEAERISKIRKLNRKIGENLKLLYCY